MAIDLFAILIFYLFWLSISYHFGDFLAFIHTINKICTRHQKHIVFRMQIGPKYVKIDSLIIEMLSWIHDFKIWCDTDSWVQPEVVITYAGRNGYLWAQPVGAAMICCTWRKRDKNRITRLYNGQDNCVWEPVWFRNLSRKVGYTHTKTKKVVYMVRLFFVNNMLYLSFSGSLT